MNTFRQIPFVRQSALGLAALFLLVFGLYLRALSPAFHPDDSPETITAGATLSIQHPPGYPLHSLLGRVADQVGPGPATFDINSLSAFNAALAVLLAALLLFKIAREFAPWSAARGPLAGLGLAGALAIGFTHQLFFQATIAKGGLYTLNLALTLGALLALLDARDALLSAPNNAPPASRAWRSFGLALLLFGLGLANHWTSQVLLVPCAVLLLAEPLYLRRPQASRALFLRLAVWLTLPLLGLALYAYLPLRTRLGAPLIWSEANSLKELLWVISRGQYAGVEAGKTLAVFGALLEYIAGEVQKEWTWPGLALLGGGWALLLLKRPWLALSLLSLPLGLAVAVAWKANPPADSYFIMDPYLIPLHTGLGLGLAGWAALPAQRRYLGWAALLLALGLGTWHWRDAEHREDYLGWDYVNNLLLSVPKDAVFFTEGDSNTAGPYVPRFVQGRRQDLTLVASVLAGYPWYQQLLTRHDPRLRVPGQSMDSPGAFMAWVVQQNPQRPAVWSNTYTPGWVDEGSLLHRGLVLRRQAKRKPFPLALLKAENPWAAYALRGVFAPQARRMDAISVRLVRDNYVEALDRLARASAESGSPKDSRALYRRLGMLRPGWAPPWLQAGNAAWFANDQAGAEADWTRASVEDPRSAEAWANLGLVAFHARRYDESASLARKALGFNSELGNAKDLLQQAMQAAVSPVHAVPSNAGQDAAVRGDQLAQAGKLAEAAAAYSRALKLGYRNAAVLRNLGVMQGQQGKHAEAAQALAQARTLSPQNVEVVKLHGFFLFNAGRREEGLVALRDAAKLDPKDPEIQRLLTEALKAASTP